MQNTHVMSAKHRVSSRSKLAAWISPPILAQAAKRRNTCKGMDPFFYTKQARTLQKFPKKVALTSAQCQGVH